MLICLWMRLQAQKWGPTCFQVCASSCCVVTVVPFASDLQTTAGCSSCDASVTCPDRYSVAASVILGQPPAKLTVYVRFCVLENIPGWTAWCQQAGQSPWSDWSAWHQDISLLWTMGFVWCRLGGGGELLSRPYWGCCNVFWVFLMSEGSLIYSICNKNSWDYWSAWKMVCLSWVGQHGTTQQGSVVTGYESNISHLHASASSGQQQSWILWKLWLHVSEASLIAKSYPCLIATKCQNHFFFLSYQTLT